MTTDGTTSALDEERGAVRLEERYDTGIDDLWAACTTPDRLARWIARVTGDLHEGSTVQAVFTRLVERTPARRRVRGPAPPAGHRPAGHRRRDADRGLADGRGCRHPARRRGARAADRGPALLRRRVAGAPRGPGAVPRARRPGARRRLVRRGPGARLARPLAAGDTGRRRAAGRLTGPSGPARLASCFGWG
nr:hypothetical protein [Angustibacter aerolatus]